tara:strand:- start:1361 stop:1543 length:183 start_codon:yes stop_codon:yes gene_type:complete
MKTEVDVQAVISGLIEEIGQKTYEIQMLRAGLSKAQEMIAALQVEITESQESSSKTSKSK